MNYTIIAHPCWRFKSNKLYVLGSMSYFKCPYPLTPQTNNNKNCKVIQNCSNFEVKITMLQLWICGLWICSYHVACFPSNHVEIKPVECLFHLLFPEVCFHDPTVLQVSMGNSLANLISWLGSPIHGSITCIKGSLLDPMFLIPWCDLLSQRKKFEHVWDPCYIIR